MTTPPRRPKLYHITHVENMASIVQEGRLCCDREMVARGGPTRAIGMSTIKRRRIEKIEVNVHPGSKVGDYVPFYFCPRSIMLYVIHRANHPELSYRGGQQPIVHMEADLQNVVSWAGKNQRRWAFTLSNAGAYYVQFRSTLDALDELDWEAIDNTDFRSREVKEPKQAEFLLEDSFPFELVERIGVYSQPVAS